MLVAQSDSLSYYSVSSCIPVRCEEAPSLQDIALNRQQPFSTKFGGVCLEMTRVKEVIPAWKLTMVRGSISRDAYFGQRCLHQCEKLGTLGVEAVTWWNADLLIEARETIAVRSDRSL